MHIFQLANYKFSRNYERLADLAQKESIICVVDYEDCRDVAQTQYLGGGSYESWRVSVRGTCYISVDSREKFYARCEALNLQFIDPEWSMQPL